MPPTIIAILPITDSLNVPQLLDLHERIIFGLLERGIKVVSYSSDGTETERSVQREFAASAKNHITVTIPSPHNNITIRVPVFDSHGSSYPIVMIQDSKHALKTFRNNLFSGARLLPLGNHAAFFQQIRDMAFEEDSPLYHRDVEKLDRQDDNAASRLFSAPSLQYLVDRHPDQLGVIIYLFVFGELCDAFQNRHISHAERINLLLRTQFFVDMWGKFIDSLECYRKIQHFISRESVDILHFLTHGLISLIVIHRDFYPDIPLIPWLHSTEVCEHLFGLARRLIKDFGLLDFHNMMPKLTVQIRESIFSTHLAESTKQTTAAASGYHHTYSNLKHLDIMALGCFPTDTMIQAIAKRASDEADSLWALLGISPDTIHSLAIQLPGVDTMVSTTKDSDDFDEEFGNELHLGSDMEELQYLIQVNECNMAALTYKERDRLQVLIHASVAATIEDQVTMYV